MSFYGIIIGIISFSIIGIFHPIVIKGEYYFGKKIWPIFLFSGIIFIIISIYLKNEILSAFMGVLGFSCLWSIHELIEQEQRVKKGWFPLNQSRKINSKR
ncbi:MAG: DUF4491 family protein [Clostridium sp.]|uniref:DUF4491 family protein n=1 Tax=Clostridium sp. TaxID=1506 RepID=UPI003D6C7F3A